VLEASSASAQVFVAITCRKLQSLDERDGLRILITSRQIIERGAEALTPREKELLKWVAYLPQAYSRQIHDAHSHAQWHREERQLRAIRALTAGSAKALWTSHTRAAKWSARFHS